MCAFLYMSFVCKLFICVSVLPVL
nr:unnamed protein product [Callosobruchus chinensis]